MTFVRAHRWDLALTGFVVGCTALALALGLTSTEIGDQLLLLCTGLLWTFTLLYGTRSRWTLFVAGRSLLYLALALSLVLTQNSASIYLGADYPGRGPIRVVLYAALALTAANMVRVLVRVQREKQHGRIDPAADVTRLPRTTDQEGPRP